MHDLGHLGCVDNFSRNQQDRVDASDGDLCYGAYLLNSQHNRGGAIAQWNCRRLPSCGPDSNPENTINTFFEVTIIFVIPKKKKKISKKNNYQHRNFYV